MYNAVISGEIWGGSLSPQAGENYSPEVSMKEITQKRLKELLDYNLDTGVFIRLTSPCNRIKAGCIAGHTSRFDGYSRITLEGATYLMHRLAFLFVNGKFPDNQTDHINHIRDDNRWLNLRDVTSIENNRNVSIRDENTSGVVGVSWSKRDEMWYARIKVNNKLLYLGMFKDKSKAIAARKDAEIKHGFHPNHGKLKGKEDI